MRRLIAVLAAVLVVLTPAAAQANPISEGFADTFADPVIVRGDDGLWYAYGTTDPLRENEGVFHRVPMAQSANPWTGSTWVTPSPRPSDRRTRPRTPRSGRRTYVARATTG